MRKGLVVLLAAVVAVMFAVPAMAGTEVSGFYRAKGWMSNFETPGSNATLAKDAPTAAYMEQRLRVRFAFGEENVKVIWFSEVDFTFGDAAGGTNVNLASGVNSNLGAQRNSGGALGGDRINLETKNIYVWFKLPNTSLDFTVGLQNQTDAYQGLLYGAADFAGVFVNGKFEPVSYKLGWAKLYENNIAKTDDMTLYVASAKVAPMKDLNVGLNFYFLQDDTGKVSTTSATNVGQFPFDPSTTAGLGFLNKKRVYTPGIDASFKLGPATLSGFFLYQTGKIDPVFDNVSEIDIKGYAADLRADANLGPGKLFVEGLYISGGDGTGNDYKSIVTLSDFNASPGGNSAFVRTDMQILLSNADDINTNHALVGAASVEQASTFGSCAQSPSNCGRGIWHVAAGYSMKLADKLTGKIGAGHLRATKLFAAEQVTNPFKKKEMGTEVNANLNYNIMKGLDFGLYAAYAWIGDYFKSAAGVDPDDPWLGYFRVNYAF